MFQDYQTKEYSGSSRPIADLRKLMVQNNWDAVLVPHNDEQRNEYLPANAERLWHITGFTGSAGTAIITAEKAILFVDGRYTIQARQQVDTNTYEIESLIDTPPLEWFKRNFTKDSLLALDPWLHSKSEIEQWSECAKLDFPTQNPIDTIWHDRPDAPCGKAHNHPQEFCGKSATEKIKDLRKVMQDNQSDLCVLNDASCVSWLFNIRGSDIAHTPLVLSRAIISQDEVLLFVNSNELDESPALCRHPDSFTSELSRLSKGRKVMLDPSKDPYAIFSLVEESNGEVIATSDPILLPRSIKNEVEIEGARQAHLRDGVAIVNFLFWLSTQETKNLDEITCVKKLEEIRINSASNNFLGNFPLRDISFDTISASGEHGAIVHYRVNESTNRKLKDGELYLFDSGAQYDDGTTDITRTIAIGKASEEEKRCFTLVLKGHIAIHRARFPEGTRGQDIDILARLALWQHGYDYDHGTGHGVGSYLSVHEGPQGISKRSTEPLRAGQILSNEPGVYSEGKFGIRIENLVLVKPSAIKGTKPMLEFENLTLAPIDRNLIDVSLLNKEELDWLNTYHARVYSSLESFLDDETKQWLSSATQVL